MKKILIFSILMLLVVLMAQAQKLAPMNQDKRVATLYGDTLLIHIITTPLPLTNEGVYSKKPVIFTYKNYKIKYRIMYFDPSLFYANKVAGKAYF